MKKTVGILLILAMATTLLGCKQTETGNNVQGDAIHNNAAQTGTVSDNGLQDSGNNSTQDNDTKESSDTAIADRWDGVYKGDGFTIVFAKEGAATEGCTSEYHIVVDSGYYVFFPRTASLTSENFIEDNTQRGSEIVTEFSYTLEGATLYYHRLICDEGYEENATLTKTSEDPLSIYNDYAAAAEDSDNQQTTADGEDEQESNDASSDVSIYSINGEEGWFVFKGDTAKDFFTRMDTQDEASIKLYFDKMVNEDQSDVVAFLTVYGYDGLHYSADLSIPNITSYSIQTSGSNFLVYTNKKKNIISVYLNLGEYIQDKLADESVIEDFKNQLRQLSNNAALFEEADRCHIDNGKNDGIRLWDITEITKQEAYELPIENQVLMADIYYKGYIGYTEDNEYFRPASDDYLVYGWNDDYSRIYLISYDEDGRIIDARQRIYQPGQCDYNSLDEQAENVYHDENAAYGVFDLDRLNDTSLYFLSEGKVRAIYLSLQKDQSYQDEMIFTKPDLKQEDLIIRKIVLIDDKAEYLRDTEMLSSDYIVQRDTYSPYDGVVNYSDIPMTIINFYEEESHLCLGYIKYYTFATEETASGFYNNIANPNATVVGNSVYIKYLYDSNTTQNWTDDTDSLLYNLGGINAPDECLWSRNYQTLEEFIDTPLALQ